MQLFIVVLTEDQYVLPLLKTYSANNYHGSVLSTKSIHHALMDSIEPEPYFGGISKMIDPELEISRPMIFVVVKKDEEVKQLAKITNEALDGIKEKGFMYSLPISFLEGLDS